MKNTSIILTFLLSFCSCSQNDKNDEEITVLEINKDSKILESSDDSITPILDSTAKEISNLLSKYPEFDGYIINTESDSYHIKGDFYGDQIEDIAILIKDSAETKIGIINYGAETEINIIGIGKDSLSATNYSWIGIFNKVEKGEILWSNFEDDWRGIDEVPENEKVRLDYDAIFAHAAESCGGGFIFWKDNKWNWLQQE